jgi:hypothetical protein
MWIGTHYSRNRGDTTINCPAGVRVGGIIGYADSGEYFKFVAGAGAVTVKADVVDEWRSLWYGDLNRANLDTKLTLLDSARTVLATYNNTGLGGHLRLQASRPPPLPLPLPPAVQTVTVPAATDPDSSQMDRQVNQQGLIPAAALRAKHHCQLHRLCSTSDSGQHDGGQHGDGVHLHQRCGDRGQILLLQGEPLQQRQRLQRGLGSGVCAGQVARRGCRRRRACMGRSRRQKGRPGGRGGPPCN